MDVSFNEVIQYDNVVLSGVGIDENDDGTPDVVLNSSCVVLNDEDSTVIRIEVTPELAALIEALNPGTLELDLVPDSFFDVWFNGNLAIDSSDDVRVIYGADTKVTIDGFFDTGEWAPYTLVVDDPDGDSGWHPPEDPDMNELFGLYVDWDADFLYLGDIANVPSPCVGRHPRPLHLAHPEAPKPARRPVWFRLFRVRRHEHGTHV